MVAGTSVLHEVLFVGSASKNFSTLTLRNTHSINFIQTRYNLYIFIGKVKSRDVNFLSCSVRRFIR